MTPRGGRDARSHRASGPGLHTSLRAVTGAVTPRGGRDTGVTGPCARPPHRSRIDRTLVRFARPHSTARRSNPTGDRDFGVTGPCARPPHRSRIDRTLVRFARPHSTARRSDPTGGRDFGVTGPCARPPPRSFITSTLARSLALATAGTPWASHRDVVTTAQPKCFKASGPAAGQ